VVVLLHTFQPPPPKSAIACESRSEIPKSQSAAEKSSLRLQFKALSALQHKALKPMRTAVLICLLAILGLGVLRWTWGPLAEPEYDADFVATVHDDSSVYWEIVIPPATWQAMEQRVREQNSVRADSDGMGDEVLTLVGRGFQKRGFAADRCRVVSKSRDPDGSIKYGGQCIWTDAPPRQTI
jgi:hypothetical protein